jgi:hypothetical protein
VSGRIWFEGNPWPNGHAIKALEFQLLLDETGLGLLLDLQSEDYNTGDPSYFDDDNADQAESDWTTKAVWGNYHSCRLSNSYWGIGRDTVPRVANAAMRISADIRDEIHVIADPVALGAQSPKPYEEHAFHIYLTGHDAVAAHDVHIAPQNDGRYAIEWSGLIALAYAGDDVFRYRFRAEAKDVPFAGFRLLKDLDGVARPRLETTQREFAARRLAARFLRDAERLVFEPGRGADPDMLR